MGERLYFFHLMHLLEKMTLKPVLLLLKGGDTLKGQLESVDLMGNIMFKTEGEDTARFIRGDELIAICGP